VLNVRNISDSGLTTFLIFSGLRSNLFFFVSHWPILLTLAFFANYAIFLNRSNVFLVVLISFVGLSALVVNYSNIFEIVPTHFLVVLKSLVIVIALGVSYFNVHFRNRSIVFSRRFNIFCNCFTSKLPQRTTYV